jgi:hypothetical protein
VPIPPGKLLHFTTTTPTPAPIFFFSISIATMSNATRGSHGSQGSAPDGRKSAPPKAQALLCHTCLQPGHPYQSCTAQCCHCKATHNGGRCDAVPHGYYPFAQLPKQATGNAGLLKRVGSVGRSWRSSGVRCLFFVPIWITF